MGDDVEVLAEPVDHRRARLERGARAVAEQQRRAVAAALVVDVDPVDVGARHAADPTSGVVVGQSSPGAATSRARSSAARSAASTTWTSRSTVSSAPSGSHGERDDVVDRPAARLPHLVAPRGVVAAVRRRPAGRSSPRRTRRRRARRPARRRRPAPSAPACRSRRGTTSGRAPRRATASRRRPGGGTARCGGRTTRAGTSRRRRPVSSRERRRRQVVRRVVLDEPVELDGEHGRAGGSVVGRRRRRLVRRLRVAGSSDVGSVGSTVDVGTACRPWSASPSASSAARPAGVPTATVSRRRRRRGAVVAADQHRQQGDGHRSGQGGDPAHVGPDRTGRPPPAGPDAQEPGPQARLP